MPRLTAKQEDDLVEALREHGTISGAATMVGVSVGAVSRRCRLFNSVHADALFEGQRRKLYSLHEVKRCDLMMTRFVHYLARQRLHRRYVQLSYEQVDAMLASIEALRAEEKKVAVKFRRVALRYRLLIGDESVPEREAQMSMLETDDASP